MDHVAVRRRTKKGFGFGVNLHRFRHAAASLWSIRDPANVRGAKDLLGQASFGIDRETLHPGTVAPRGPCARPCRRRSTKVSFGVSSGYLPCDSDHARTRILNRSLSEWVTSGFLREGWKPHGRGPRSRPRDPRGSV